MIRTIALEEHFATPAFLAAQPSPMRFPEQTIARLLDLGSGRLAEMDATRIDMQVLSLIGPGLQQAAPSVAATIAREANDALIAAIARHPDRLAGFAALPTSHPAGALAEAQRVLGAPGIVGVMVHGHTSGRYLDDPEYDDLLALCAERSMPLYVHPTPPPAAVTDTWFRGLSDTTTGILRIGGWAWHVETSTHLLRLIVSGALDRHPELELVVGHMGEGILFMLPRFDRALSQNVTGLEHPVSHYLRTRVHYTMAGFNWLSAFDQVRTEVGVDRLMFSTDYPMSSMAEAREFLDTLPVADEERAAIASGTAEKLFGL